MGDGLIGWAIRRPVTITVGVVLVVMFGALAVVGLPIQLTPDVTVPTLSVTTRWPGATPTEVEAEILEQQEEALKSLPGLVRMRSQASQEQAEITLELEVGANLTEALVRATNLLSQVSDYPENARQPAVSTASSTGPPLAVLVIQRPDGGEVAAWGTYIDETVVPRLERIRGVASVRLIAGRDQEIHVDFDPNALAARGVTVGRLAQAVRGELVDISGGDMPLGKRRYIVRTEVSPHDPRQLEELVLATGDDGTPVRLGDVATVRPGLRKADAVGLVNGMPTMPLLLFREAGSNVLEVTREIHRVTAELQTTYLAPEGLEMRIVSDQIDYIEGALALVEQNLLIGGVLAVLVLLLFLRSVSASVVVAISIPVSVIGTALGMSLLGRTVNLVSLAGMAFAVGMVVDNSIVVLEAIDTWRTHEKVEQAALHGTREVWGAILASTLTTAAVFLPIIGWQDEVGELLRDVAVAISTAVFVSLVVSVLVIPSFSARLLRRRKATDAETAGSDRGVRARIGRQVHWVVRKPLRAFMISVIGLGGATWLGIAFVPPLEYLPTGNRNVVFGVVIPPPGYSVDEMRVIGEQVMKTLVSHTGVEKDGFPALRRSFFVGRLDQAFMGAVGDDPDRMKEVAALVRQAQASVPGVFAFANQASLFGRSLGGGRSIEIDLLSSDQIGTIQFGQRLMGAIREALPGAQVRPIPGLDFGAPEFRVRPNRPQAARLGLTGADLGLLVDAYVDGAIIGELGRAGEPKRDVVLRARGVIIDDPEALAAAPVPTPSGRVVPLSEIAHLDETLGPTVIQHIERRRALTLQVSPPDTVPLETAISTLRDDVIGKLVAEGAAPDDLTVEYSGSAGQLDLAKKQLGSALLMALIISFLLLAALFEDFMAPLAILVSVPLAGAGGVLTLRAVDRWLGPQPLDMMTAMGFIILIGVVVNNAILVVDGALVRMRSGMALADAVADAVRRRVRPITMSVLTSLAGLLPLVIFPGAGSELYRGVGAVVLGGLALSTLLTLYLVPAVFTTLWRVRLALGGRLGGATAAPPD